VSNISLNLIIGSSLQVERLADDTGLLHNVTLIGYKTGHTLITTAPNDVPFAEGERCLVRFECGDNRFAFNTHVMSTRNHPFPYLHFDYPRGVQSVMSRRNQRLPVNDLVMMLVMEDAGRKFSVALADISASGARLVANQRLGAVGEKFSIEIPNQVYQATERVVLPCAIRYVREENRVSQSGTTVFHHGVEFSGLTQKALVFIGRYISDKVVESRKLGEA
jgi:c-di-GMP-binding flagellar brake protein YcgR